MLALSLLLNIVIVLPLATAMLTWPARLEPAFGIATQASRILACVYFAIGGVSAYALVLLATAGVPAAAAVAVPLFALQILYKLGTVFAVGLLNPVVRTNLMVVGVHAVTLVALARG